MANWVVPTSLDADNSAGSFTLAACNDWRSGVRRFHVGTGHHELTSDAGYDCRLTLLATTIDQPLPLRGESIYVLPNQQRLSSVAMWLTINSRGAQRSCACPPRRQCQPTPALLPLRCYGIKVLPYEWIWI